MNPVNLIPEPVFFALHYFLFFVSIYCIKKIYDGLTQLSFFSTDYTLDIEELQFAHY